MLFTGNDRVMVKVSGDLWYLNPKLLIPAPGETPPDVPGMTLNVAGVKLTFCFQSESTSRYHILLLLL